MADCSIEMKVFKEQLGKSIDKIRVWENERIMSNLNQRRLNMEVSDILAEIYNCIPDVLKAEVNE